MLDTRKLIQPFIDAEINRLTAKARTEARLKDLSERLNPPKKSSGIKSYEGRVAFYAGMYYPIFKEAYKVQTEYNERIGNNTNQILEWTCWVDEDKVDPHDVWVYIFECMNDVELAAWQSRFNDIINDSNTSDVLISWLKSIIDISFKVVDKENKIE